MKKLICSVMAALFLAAVGAPVFAADASMTTTPTVKTVKHKARRHHKKASHKKSAAKPESTPMSK